MTKSQLNIAAMLKKAGRKVTIIDTTKTLTPAQMLDEYERENRNKPVFSHCNVCGRGLIRKDELAVGMCAICANEEMPEE